MPGLWSPSRNRMFLIGVGVAVAFLDVLDSESVLFLATPTLIFGKLPVRYSLIYHQNHPKIIKRKYGDLRGLLFELEFAVKTEKTEKVSIMNLKKYIYEKNYVKSLSLLKVKRLLKRSLFQFSSP